jgi:hypothetical protein
LLSPHQKEEAIDMLAELQGTVSFIPKELLTQEGAECLELWATGDLAHTATVPVQYVRKAMKSLGHSFAGHAQKTAYPCYTPKGRLTRRQAWLIPVWLRHTIINEAQAMYRRRQRRSGRVKRVRPEPGMGLGTCSP